MTVAGTPAPGNAVVVAATNIDAHTAATTPPTTAGPDGAFSSTVP